MRWIRANLSDMDVSPPEITTGEVGIHFGAPATATGVAEPSRPPRRATRLPRTWPRGPARPRATVRGASAWALVEAETPAPTRDAVDGSP